MINNKKNKLVKKPIKINGLTFFEFLNQYGIAGLDFYSKRTNNFVPKFMMFWNGLTVDYIRKNYISKIKDKTPIF